MNPVCEKFRNINLLGNIVPIRWYQAIRNESEKPDAIAVSILADIVYWYMPMEIRDEKTGAVTGYAQKFKTDKLGKSYQDYANLFGFSKKQVKAAIENLVRQGFITCESSPTSDEKIFLEPVFERIMEITYSSHDISVPSFSENSDNLQPEGIFVVTNENLSVPQKEEKVVKRLRWRDFEHNWRVHIGLQEPLKKMNPDDLEALKAEYRRTIQEYPNLLQIFDIEELNHTKFLFFCYSEKGIMPSERSVK